MVSNVIVLVTTLATMLLLEWKLTILTLVVLPLFILPARRVGRRLADIARDQMNLNSRLNTQMTERFNVAGATLVKLFGQSDEEHREFAQRASKVRDNGIRSAMYGRVFFVALGIVAAVGAAMVYGVGGQQVISGTIQVGTLVAMASYTGRIYQPLTGLTNARVDIMSSLVSFERVFEVLDAPVAIIDKPSAVDLVAPTGRIEFDHVSFRYPPADDVTIASLTLPGAEGQESDRLVLEDVDLVVRARAARGARRAVRRRQVHPGRADPAPVRRDGRRGAGGRSRRPRPDRRLPPGRHRRGEPGPAPLPRVHRRQPPLRAARGHGRGAGRGLPGGADLRHHRRPARRVRHGRGRARLPAVGR